MSTRESSTVIHKMARHAREDVDARAMSPSKAFRLSLERACDRRLSLALTVCAVEQRSVPGTELKAQAEDDVLILLVEGQEGAPPGVILMDRQMVQALVEVQTVGSVRSGPAPQRPFTDTDGAIAAPLIDAMMTGYDDRMAEDHEDHERIGLRFADRVADARALMLVLEETAHELFRMTCDIGSGARTGELTLMLPEAALARPDAAPAGGAAAARFELSELAMTAPVALDAVLDRVTLPLSRVMQLRPGMTLPVDVGGIARTELAAAGGHVAAVTQLGQMNGFRAVRLAGTRESGAVRMAPAGTAEADTPTGAPPGEAAETTAQSGGDRSSGLSDAPEIPGLPGSTDPTGAADPPALAEAEDDSGQHAPALPDIPELGEAT